MSKSEACIELPVFDIFQPLNPSLLSSLSQTCKESGFFLLTNHGVSKDLYHRFYYHSTRLFNLRLQSKLKAGPFSPIKTCTTSFIASPFFESLRVSGPDFFSSAQSSTLLLFNQHNSEFSEIQREYGSKMTEMSKRIVEVVLMSLGENFDKKFYESEFSKCHGYLRIINYSPPPENVNEEHDQEEEVHEGLRMHTDMGCLTIIYQDQIGGLQVRSKEGKY